MRRFLFCCLLWLGAVAAPAQILNTPYSWSTGYVAEGISFLPGNRFTFQGGDDVGGHWQGVGRYKRHRHHLTLVFTADPYQKARRRAAPTRISFQNLGPLPDTLIRICIHLIDNATGKGIPDVGFSSGANPGAEMLTDSAGWATAQYRQYAPLHWYIHSYMLGEYDIPDIIWFPYRHVEITIQAGPAPDAIRFIRAGKRQRYRVQPDPDHPGHICLRGRRLGLRVVVRESPYTNQKLAEQLAP